MAVDMFLKIDDVKGESVDEKHKEEIDVLAWSWGMSQSGTTHIGGGGGSGKVAVQDISITKYVDKASPNLIKSCCNGKHYKEATLIVRKAGEKPLEYLKITLKEVLIANISTGGSGGEDRLTLEYAPQKKDGTGEAAITAAWDIAENRDAG